MSTRDVTIESIAAGGDGIARADGVVVFIPRSAPGDRARVRLDVRKRFARGEIEEVLEPSPLRVDPLCYHYRVDRCGGCQLQHIGYESQLAAKQGIIRDTLRRIGKRDVAPPPIVASADEWRYRQKLTLAMRSDRRSDWVIGLHPYDDPVGVFQLADCPITDERVLRVWREVIEASPYFPRADELRASVRLLDGGAAVVMEGGNDWPQRTRFFESVPRATELWWKPANRTRTLVAQRGRAAAGASFAQVNARIGQALHEFVLDRARSYKPRRVIDGYAGAGATAIPLAQSGADVVAIEVDRDASAFCASRLPHGSRALAARVEDVLAAALPADVVLLNPPRTGVHELVSATLESVEPRPRAIIYVSCDPATLARDLSRLPGYRVAALRAFDMFPQTAHVETVCELVPDAA